MTGGRLLLVDDMYRRQPSILCMQFLFSASLFIHHSASLLLDEHVSVMQCTASLLRLFSTPQLSAFAVSSWLRVLAFGGEVLRQADLCTKSPTLFFLSSPHGLFFNIVPFATERWRSNELRLFNVYGTTEMSVWASMHEFLPPLLPADPLPVGEALSETVLELVDERVIIRSDTRHCYVDGRRLR